MRFRVRLARCGGRHALGRVRRFAMAGLALPCVLITRGASRPELFRIELKPTSVSGSGSGTAVLTMPESPFGMTLTADGHFLYNMTLTVQGLPRPSALGAYTTYVAWVTTENLDMVRRIGVVHVGEPMTSPVDYHKFIVLVSAEKTGDGAHWNGPVLLRGFSPGMYLDNFSGKELFNGGVPQ